MPFAVFALLALISWNRWLEPYVDSGRELMVPWRVSRGERLYAQVEFHHGPLAPWAGAVLDRAFGASLPARTALAAVIALLNLAGLSALARRLLSPWRAGLAASVAVAAAMFLRPGAWLFPFSFDAAIAVAATVWALELSLRQTRSGDALAGVALALALLARLEVGLAVLAVIAVVSRDAPRRLGRLVAWPLAAATAGYLVASAGIPLRILVSDGWLRLLDPPEAFRNVYRAYAGLDQVGLRGAEWVLAAIVLLLASALLAVASFTASRLRSPSGRFAASALAIAALAVVAAARLRPAARFAAHAALFPPLVRVIPLCVAAAALGRLALRLAGRPPRGVLAAVPDAVLGVAALFGARLLLAAGYAGPYNAYFLPLPLVVAVAAIFDAADRGALRLGAELPRLAAAALAIFVLVRIVDTVDRNRGPRWARVSTPAGSVVLPEPVAETTRATLEDLEERLKPGATLSGFPEAGFFNYVLGRRNPFRHEQYFPGHLDAAAEARFAADLAAHPPDALLYANVLAVGEGAGAFGEDYMADLDAAVRTRTRVAANYGPGAREEARIGDPDFFVEVRVPVAP